MIKRLKNGPRVGGRNRNAPCPCGSQLKLKRCCWHSSNVASGKDSMTALTVKVWLKDMRYEMKQYFKENGRCLTKEEISTRYFNPSTNQE